MSGRAESGLSGGVGAAEQNADAPEPVCFSLAALLDDLRLHAELDVRTLAYHLRQSDATAADGYCHAAINEARSFLEALVVSIVHAVERDTEAQGADGNGRSGGHTGTAFRTYRRQLVEAGFLDADENTLLQYVYSVASAKGSHHGVTDEAWTRLARRIVFAAAQYLLVRYAAWKHHGRQVAPPPGNRRPRSRGGRLTRALGVLLGK